MSSERHQRAKQLFIAALDKTAAERTDFLRAECGEDDDLRADVEGMLAFEDSAPDFLESSALAGEASADEVRAPERIGPFRILRKLGHGGMGAVYEAEQERPRRRVALKLLHPALASERMLRRFEYEAEVLARLQHPGIARVYDAGSEEGPAGTQPWFAMELIEGEALTAHCDRAELSLAERMRLFAAICDAVQHAHQMGIIHRDLKPANILIDSSGAPKVLDFGIARATDADLQCATLLTEVGQVVGTLQYMSPEQASADPDALDVRSDVYALGAMLYELLAGFPPLELARLPMQEALRRVVEQDPRSLVGYGRVPEDLARIAHKALEKERERRYASAGELAADLRRFERHEPVTAQSPSSVYRMRRFAARHKALVAGATTTLLALVAGLVLTLWQVGEKTIAEREAKAHQREAEDALARARGVNRFLLEDLLAAPGAENFGHDVRVVDVLAPAASSARRAFANEPLVAAEVLDAVGGSYLGLGLSENARGVLEQAEELLREEDAVDSRLGLRVRMRLANAQRAAVPPAESVARFRAIHDDAARVLGPEDEDTLDYRVELAVAQWKVGEHELCFRELERVVDIRTATIGARARRTLETKGLHAMYVASVGEGARAYASLEQVLADQEEVLGRRHPATLQSKRRLAWVASIAGERERALELYLDILPLLEELYGVDHPHTSDIRASAAPVLMQLGRDEQAREMAERAVRNLVDRLGDGHERTEEAKLGLVEIYFRSRDFSRAIALAAEVVEARRARLDPENELIGDALQKLGRAHQDAGQLAEAREALEEAAGIFRSAFGPENRSLAETLFTLGVILYDMGDPHASVLCLREGLDIDVALWGSESVAVRGDRYRLALSLLETGAADEAVLLMGDVLAVCSESMLTSRRGYGYRALLGRALFAAGALEEAETAMLVALDGLERTAPGDSRIALLCSALAGLYEQTGDEGRAGEYRARASR